MLLIVMIPWYQKSERSCMGPSLSDFPFSSVPRAAYLLLTHDITTTGDTQERSPTIVNTY